MEPGSPATGKEGVLATSATRSQNAGRGPAYGGSNIPALQGLSPPSGRPPNNGNDNAHWVPAYCLYCALSFNRHLHSEVCTLICSISETWSPSNVAKGTPQLRLQLPHVPHPTAVLPRGRGRALEGTG